MAETNERSTGQGLKFFYLDIHLNDKFKILQIRYGLEGFGAVIALFQKVYNNGFWYPWTEIERELFAHDYKTTEETIDEIVDCALEVGIFHKPLFEQYRILTSRGIQNEYMRVTSRRTAVESIQEFRLIDGYFGKLDKEDKPTQIEVPVPARHQQIARAGGHVASELQAACIHDVNMVQALGQHDAAFIELNYTEREREEKEKRLEERKNYNVQIGVQQELPNAPAEGNEVVQESLLKDLDKEEKKKEEAKRIAAEEKKAAAAEKRKQEQERREEQFKEFWEKYPRKVNRKKAKTSWDRINPSEELFEKIMTSLDRFIRSEWRGTAVKFIPHPTTWLNGERWNDKVPVGSSSPAGQGRYEVQPTDEEYKGADWEETEALIESLLAEAETKKKESETEEWT